MTKLYIYLAVFILTIGFIKWYSDNQFDSGRNSCLAEAATLVVENTNKIRLEEQAKQDKVNEVTQKQFNKINIINSELNADLDRLRKRTPRKQLSVRAKAYCEGASGKALSGPDAEFLTREAARADKLRTALKGCYEYADEVVK